MAQETFNPANYAFNWTKPENPSNEFDLGWYEWDRKEGHKLAKQARDKRYQELRAQGKTPVKYSMRDCLTKKGGAGTGKPDLEFIVTYYGVSYS